MSRSRVAEVVVAVVVVVVCGCGLAFDCIRPCGKAPPFKTLAVSLFRAGLIRPALKTHSLDVTALPHDHD